MDLVSMEQVGMCFLDIVHPLKDVELDARTMYGPVAASRASYIENAFNTQNVLGISKEVLEARNLEDDRTISPGLRALWSRFAEQAPPGEHRQHNENTLATGTPCKVQTTFFMAPHLTPMVTTFVTALEVHNKCIRTSWTCIAIMDKEDSGGHHPLPKA